MRGNRVTLITTILRPGVPTGQQIVAILKSWPQVAIFLRGRMPTFLPHKSPEKIYILSSDKVPIPGSQTWQSL